MPPAAGGSPPARGTGFDGLPGWSRSKCIVHIPTGGNINQTPQQTWRSPRHGVPIQRFGAVSSTIDLAQLQAPLVGAAGLLIVADQQTSGRGTRGRAWQSPAGSLAVTFVGPGIGRPELGLLVGMAAVNAIGDMLEALGAATRPRLRWPNDVVVAVGTGWAKVAGCLTQVVGKPGSTTILASVGINVNNDPGQLGAGLRTPAASLRQVAGQDIDPVQLADCLADNLKEAVQAPLHVEVLARAEAMLAALGEVVTVRGPGGLVGGRVLGLSPDGGLRLKCADEREEVVRFSAEIIDPARECSDDAE